MNILFCSVGRRGELVKIFRKSIKPGSRIIALDNSPYAPALYLADKQYLVPCIDVPEYMDVLLDICSEEQINAVTTFIDPEIEILAKNRGRFAELGIEALVPSEHTAQICFDKYKMYKHLCKHGIATVMTWGTLQEFDLAYADKEVDFPVFVKPRTGSGSVNARKIGTYEELAAAIEFDSTLIVQEFMDCLDLDVDVYIDTISHKAVTAFSKKKIETRIGGASKTVSLKDQGLFDFIIRVASAFEFNGPVDMDLFYRDGRYYLSEINPRFGGAYLHAYGAGVDFIKLIENNLNGIENQPCFGEYENGVVMMMYDSAVIQRSEDLVSYANGFAGT